MTATDAAQAAQQARPAPDDRPDGAASAMSVATQESGRYGMGECVHCGKTFQKNKEKHDHCSDTCRYAEYDKRNPRINKVMAKEEQPGLYPGKVFYVSIRNANIRAKSVKGGWKYELVAEMTAEDFDLFNGHDLTGSLFEAQLECVEIAQLRLPIEEKPKGGSLSISAAMICSQPLFWKFANARNDEEAADYIRTYCCVESRAMIDNDENAKRKFITLMANYREWQKG